MLTKPSALQVAQRDRQTTLLMKELEDRGLLRLKTNAPPPQKFLPLPQDNKISNVKTFDRDKQLLERLHMEREQYIAQQQQQQNQEQVDIWAATKKVDDLLDLKEKIEEYNRDALADGRPIYEITQQGLEMATEIIEKAKSEDPLKVLDGNSPLENELKRIYGRETTLENYFSLKKLPTEPAPERLTAAFSKSPSSENVGVHLQDIRNLMATYENYSQDASQGKGALANEFLEQMTEKMKSAHQAMDQLDGEYKRIRQGALVPIDPTPAKNNMEMLMQMVKIFFGKTFDLKPEQEQLLTRLKDSMVLMQERVTEARNAIMHHNQKISEKLVDLEDSLVQLAPGVA